MKKTILFLAILLSISLVTKATDIKVNETGSMGAKTSITAALAVAIDGDRILVEPKAGNAPYIENFTISKSIQILCNAESTQFAVQGNISITPSAVKEISIIGLDLTGNISSTTDANAASRSIVRIMFSKVLGKIQFDNNNYDVTVANCIINGSVTLRSGRVIGNEITTEFYGVNVPDEAGGVAVPISDTLQIIGNRIYTVYNSSSTLINITSLKYFYQISNNYLYYSSRGIYISGWTSNVNGNHEIVNNSFKRMNYNTNSYAMFFSGIPTGGVLKVFNNLLDGYYSGSPTGIYLTSMTNGILFISYNAFSSTYSNYITGITNDGTNIIGGTFTVDGITGQPTSGAYTNIGHPDFKYYDHDLSRNDVGCYGGSLSARNFFPTGDANHNRIYMLNIPSNIYIGNPIKVKAECFDK